MKHYQDLHTLEMHGGRNYQDVRVFCDLIVLNQRNEVIMTSVIGKHKDVMDLYELFQNGKIGRIYYNTKDYREKKETLRRTIYCLDDKKNNYNQYQTRFDDLTHMLIISKSVMKDTRERQKWELEEEQRVKNGEPLRNLPKNLADIVIAWDGDLQSQVFKTIKDRYSTPILDEWKDYIYQKLLEEKYIEPLNVFSFGKQYTLDGAVLRFSEKQLESIITEGIQSYNLNFAILDDERIEPVLDQCTTLDEYLNHFAGSLAEAIQKNVHVRFDPKRDKHHPGFYHLNLHANKNGLTGLFPQQADTVMGVAKTLEEEKFVFVIGEMGK